MPSRRHVLALLAATPFAGCAPSDLPDPAAGWRTPGAAETDLRRFALAHAILAPNPHNTQPWIVELDDADGMTLYCDLERRLPATDPLDRQITIGCGCFVELYRQAAASRGYAPSITQFPNSEPSFRLNAAPIAHVRLGPIVGDPMPELLQRITARRTNREAYEARIPDENALTALQDAVLNTGEEYEGDVRWTNDPARVALGRDLVWRAWDRELRTETAMAETFEWLRFGREEIARHRDGLSIDAPGVGVMRALGQLDRAHLIDPESMANKQAADQWRDMAMSSPAFLWLTSSDNTPMRRLSAGRAYARLALAAVEQGLAIHPWSQALQEYPEMHELYVEMKDYLGVSAPETAQMLVRVGYAQAPSPAPRRDMAAFVRA